MADAQVQVIKRNTIPPITTIEEGGQVHHLGELRDFSWSEPLRAFMRDASGFSASWVQLAHREVLQPHTHPVLSMMVFYGGDGELIGDIRRPLEGDEVVVVPAGCLHGFIGGPSGLFALSIQFARGLYSVLEKPRVVFSQEEESLGALVALTERRMAGFARKPLLGLLREGGRAGSSPQRKLLGALDSWRVAVERLLVAAEATCTEPRYVSGFRERRRRLTSVDSPRPGASRTRARDSALEAITSWFSYQMYVLDDVEKMAVLDLVVERVNGVCRRNAADGLGSILAEQVFGRSTKADEAGPSESELFGHEVPATYARLKGLVNEAWDMAETMADRVVAVVLPAS